MPRTIIATTRARLEASAGEDEPLIFMKIDHPDLTAPIRVVNDNATRNGLPVIYRYLDEEWVAFPFRLELLTDSDEPPRGRLEVANVNQKIGEAIRGIFTPPEVELSVLPTTEFDLDADPRASPEEQAWTLVGQTSLAIPIGEQPDVVLPGYLKKGDVVVVALACDGSLITEGIQTSGYTNLAYVDNALPGHQLAIKVMGETPDETVSILADPGPAGSTAAVIQVWRGVDRDNPLDVAVGVATGASGMPHSPAITPNTDGALVLAVGFLDDDIIVDGTVPAGFSNFLYQATGTAGAGATVFIASLEKEIAGLVTPAAFGGSGSDDWRAATFVLRRAPVPVPIYVATGLTLRNIQVDALSVTADIISLDDTREPWPALRATESVLPALYRR